MEFHEKLQTLRKRKGLTQEQLAAQLYVSRTAISKWESGRGYPNLDSLRELSNYFSVSLDDLLSEKELTPQKDTRDLFFSLLDCSVVVFFLLPFFGQRSGGAVKAVSLLSLTGIAPYVKIPYLVAVIGMICSGALTLALQNRETPNKRNVSLLLSLTATLLFMVSLQPYAATFVFLGLVVKALLMIRFVSRM